MVMMETLMAEMTSMGTTHTSSEEDSDRPLSVPSSKLSRLSIRSASTPLNCSRMLQRKNVVVALSDTISEVSGNFHIGFNGHR